MTREDADLTDNDMNDLNAFEKQLQLFVGAEAGPFLAWDRVNRAMIRHWCEAMGDANPAYHNASVAAKLGAPAGAVMAPPTMMQALSLIHI